MTIMSPQEFKVLNASEKKKFYVAVSSGDGEKVRTMLEEKPDLVEIKLPNGILPIHMAASCGHHQVVMHLYSFLKHKVDGILTEEEEVKLFFMTLENDMFGKATHLSFFLFPFFLKLKQL